MMLKRKRMSCNAWKMFEDGLFTGQWSAGGRPLLWCNPPMQIPRKLRFPSFTGKPPPPAHSWWRERKTPYNSRCWEGRLGFGASGEVKMVALKIFSRDAKSLSEGKGPFGRWGYQGWPSDLCQSLFNRNYWGLQRVRFVGESILKNHAEDVEQV